MTSRRSVLKMLGVALALPVVSRFTPTRTPPPPVIPPLPVAAAVPPDPQRVVLVTITSAMGRPGVYRGIIAGGAQECHVLNAAEGAGCELAGPGSLTHIGYTLDRAATDGKPVVLVNAAGRA